jgi:hypothetical protein
MVSFEGNHQGFVNVVATSLTDGKLTAPRGSGFHPRVSKTPLTGLSSALTKTRVVQ